jgi:hypothetical protein
VTGLSRTAMPLGERHFSDRIIGGRRDAHFQENYGSVVTVRIRESTLVVTCESLDYRCKDSSLIQFIRPN